MKLIPYFLNSITVVLLTVFSGAWFYLSLLSLSFILMSLGHLLAHAIGLGENFINLINIITPFFSTQGTLILCFILAFIMSTTIVMEPTIKSKDASIA